MSTDTTSTPDNPGAEPSGRAATQEQQGAGRGARGVQGGSSPLAYKAVPAQIDLPAMEHEILDFWQANKTFEATLAKTADGEPWTFYEGPPTANGQPGTHHIEARVFKDVFPRFKTMQGRRVDRKAGWDCHGLPVELAVEKELGIDSKDQIEDFGVEAFNAKCRESVSRHVGQFAELTNRMGYWVNMDEAYWTMAPEYVDSEWWALKTIFDKGLLVEDFRVAPYCPNDQTALSDHELAQGYEDTVDTTVFARFPLTSGPWAGKADLAIWTTTPWTLVANVTVAAGADIDYCIARKEGETPVVIAVENVPTALGEEWIVAETFKGSEMEGWTYQRPFDAMEQPGKAFFVVLEDYVAVGEGTGLVHQAMAFGQDDYESNKRHGVEFVNPIGANGCFKEGTGFVSGLFFKKADPVIIDKLRETGLLLGTLDHEHPYPHCWRCHTPLMYYAMPSWYIRTTQRKDQLLAENEKTNWYPESIKHGRFGDWLENNIDWALSRSRYWGTPLPVWRNDEDPTKVVCVGSRAELSELAGDPSVATMDPHRPFVDDVTFTLPGHGGTYRRVPEVIDAWFDSGSMPFAQWGFPWVEGSKEKFEANYPADFICEATDQTRGWFYTLMAVNTLVFDQSSYKNVLCLGHILAEDGRKMSKHLGNILLPIPLMDKHGADAVRWFMAASGSPWAARRVGDGTITETVRKVLLTYWNTVAFHALYANANNFVPGGTIPPNPPALADRHVLDRWLTSATNKLVVDVTEALENFDTQHAGSRIATFVDELSNWYVRRSRRRFWDGDQSALTTLHETLEVLTRLMAPLVPFITERVWQDLFVAADPEASKSVHLADWPVADTSVIDEQLDKAMDMTKRLVELGRSARAEAKVKTRQPLARMLVPSYAHAQLDDSLVAEIAAELNINSIESFSSAGDVVDYSAKGNFRALGKRFAKQTPLVAKAIAEADAAKLAADLTANGTATVDFDGGTQVSADEVIISERPREGWSVVNEQGETVALDLQLTPELVQAGLARDAIRFVQETRKASGLEVSDRIHLQWAATGDLASAISTHQQLIADEVLATQMEAGVQGDDWKVEPELGLAVKVTRL
ncbi:isoleucine--tRNA ligase [Luteococcus sp. Sow4_B9]|uniref:isoleucine--tRNA ligase n=1 Tax=Luteococcus sp. Sow4_B9 TaxID=3438792 RepID=UPI003F98BC1F